MSVVVKQFQTVRFIQMMSLTFGLFTQVSGSGPLGPLVFLISQQNLVLTPHYMYKRLGKTVLVRITTYIFIEK